VHLVKKINSLCKASNKTIEIFEYEMNRLINLYVYIWVRASCGYNDRYPNTHTNMYSLVNEIQAIVNTIESLSYDCEGIGKLIVGSKQ